MDATATATAAATCDHCGAELDEYGTFRGEPIYYGCSDCGDRD